MRCKRGYWRHQATHEAGSLTVVGSQLNAQVPVDAPEARVMAALGMLGFEVVREGNHISMRRPKSSGGSDCLTMPNHSTIKASTLRTVLAQAGITRAEFPDAYEQA